MKFQVNDKSRDMTVNRKNRNGTIINKTKEFITVKYKNLGNYKESFAYIDFITGSVKLLS
ncbi:hypothetical protein [Clostridium sp.]|uniref:hypothetical protein n=1 Tax=Clostridium sp. TaxID=1506 RepID=UPI002FC5F5DB